MTLAGRPVSLIRLLHLTDKSKSSEPFALWRFRNQVNQVNQVKRPLHGKRNSPMATKTKAIEVKVDERLAEAISDKAVKAWPATKSQSMTVTALGFPAITVVTTTSQAATNDGDDEGANTQTTSADVKPDVDASVVPTP